MKQESLTEGTVAGAGGNAKSRTPYNRNKRNNDRTPPVQGHATIADLKAKLTGKSPSRPAPKAPQVQIGKMNSILKQIMKKG